MNNEIMERMGFKKESELIAIHKCPWCAKSIDFKKDFKDSISKKEYAISGLCQCCQDKFFKGDKDE